MEGTSGPGEDAPPSDKGQPPPPPSPLSGAYLLIIVGEPHSEEHKEDILRKIANGFKSWDFESCHVSLDKEINNIITQAPEGEEARNGERLIQFASENLVTEVLIQPQLNTLIQCVRNLLSSFTKHRHLIHAGYTFASNGSWLIQDGTFSLADLIDAFKENDVLRVLRAYENSVTVDIHCAPEGEWSTARFRKEAFSKLCRVRVNPDDCPSPAANIQDFIGYISPFLKPTSLQEMLEPSDVVGNIRFSHPTLYVFPGGQGDAALFGINGFNMLVDGGFARKACFWDFTRHLDRLDAVLMTRINNSNVNGLAAVLRRKKINHVYPQIGHFFCNFQERRQPLTPDADKVRDPLLINLLDEGQEILQNLHPLQLKPHNCYRENIPEPINLYHKVGHGKLDMYVLSPHKDSKELKEFLAKWNSHDSSLFGSSSKKFGDKEFSFPIQNLVSICALLVWQPANPCDTITRILFPGSTPQHKIFEGLDKLKHLEFLKHPVCSAKSLSPSSSNLGINAKFSKQKTTPAVIDKLLPGEQINKVPPKPIPSVESVNKQNIAKSATIPVTGSIIENKTKHMSRAKLKTEKTKIEKTEVDTTIESETKVDKSSPPPEIVKKTDKIKEKPKKTESKVPPKVDKKGTKSTPTEKKSDSVKSSPTTPKKIVENKTDKMNGVATKSELNKASVTRSSNKPKASPSSTPAKSAKEENNRKVVESKHKPIPSRPPTGKTIAKKEETKPKLEKKIMKKTTSSPTKTLTKQSSPVKSVTKTATKRKEIKKVKSEIEKGVATDSSAVSTPSTVDAEMTVLKETKTEEKVEQTKKEELKENVSDINEQQTEEEDISKDIDEGVEIKDKADESLTEDIAEEEKIVKDIKEEETLDSLTGEKESEKEEEDEILIIEKVEVEQYGEDSSIQDQDSIESHLPDEVEDEIQKHMRDEAESEKKEKHFEETKEEYKEEEIIEDIKKEEDIEADQDVIETEVKGVAKSSQDLKLKLVSSLTTDRLTPENKEQIFEEVQEIISSATEIAKSKIETAKDISEVSAEGIGSDEQRTSGDTKDLLSSGEKMNVVSDKNLIESAEDENKFDETKDKSKDLGDARYGAEESQPDEKFSTTVESGATTAPTLPEDERIPLDEIKEQIEEKYVKEDTKEKDIGAPTKLEQPTSLPQVAVTGSSGFEARGVHVQLRDIVKTPDEVADLPVHEEVDGVYEDDEFGQDIHKSKDDFLNVVSHKIEKEETENFDEKETKEETKEDNLKAVEDEVKLVQTDEDELLELKMIRQKLEEDDIDFKMSTKHKDEVIPTDKVHIDDIKETADDVIKGEKQIDLQTRGSPDRNEKDSYELYTDSGVEEEPVHGVLKGAEVPEFVTVPSDSAPESPFHEMEKSNQNQEKAEALERVPPETEYSKKTRDDVILLPETEFKGIHESVKVDVNIDNTKYQQEYAAVTVEEREETDIDLLIDKDIKQKEEFTAKNIDISTQIASPKLLAEEKYAQEHISVIELEEGSIKELEKDIPPKKIIDSVFEKELKITSVTTQEHTEILPDNDEKYQKDLQNEKQPKDKSLLSSEKDLSTVQVQDKDSPKTISPAPSVIDETTMEPQDKEIPKSSTLYEKGDSLIQTVSKETLRSTSPSDRDEITLKDIEEKNNIKSKSPTPFETDQTTIQLQEKISPKSESPVPCKTDEQLEGNESSKSVSPVPYDKKELLEETKESPKSILPVPDEKDYTTIQPEDKESLKSISPTPSDKGEPKLDKESSKSISPVPSDKEKPMLQKGSPESVSPVPVDEEEPKLDEGNKGSPKSVSSVTADEEEHKLDKESPKSIIPVSYAKGEHTLQKESKGSPKSISPVPYDEGEPKLHEESKESPKSISPVPSGIGELPLQDESKISSKTVSPIPRDVAEPSLQEESKGSPKRISPVLFGKEEHLLQEEGKKSPKSASPIPSDKAESELHEESKESPKSISPAPSGKEGPILQEESKGSPKSLSPVQPGTADREEPKLDKESKKSPRSMSPIASAEEEPYSLEEESKCSLKRESPEPYDKGELKLHDSSDKSISLVSSAKEEAKSLKDSPESVSSVTSEKDQATIQTQGKDSPKTVSPVNFDTFETCVQERGSPTGLNTELPGKEKDELPEEMKESAKSVSPTPLQKEESRLQEESKERPFDSSMQLERGETGFQEVEEESPKSIIPKLLQKDQLHSLIQNEEKVPSISPALPEKILTKLLDIEKDSLKSVNTETSDTYEPSLISKEGSPKSMSPAPSDIGDSIIQSDKKDSLKGESLIVSEKDESKIQTDTESTEIISPVASQIYETKLQAEELDGIKNEIPVQFEDLSATQQDQKNSVIYENERFQTSTVEKDSVKNETTLLSDREQISLPQDKDSGKSISPLHFENKDPLNQYEDKESPKSVSPLLSEKGDSIQPPDKESDKSICLLPFEKEDLKLQQEGTENSKDKTLIPTGTDPITILSQDKDSAKSISPVPSEEEDSKLQLQDKESSKSVSPVPTETDPITILPQDKDSVKSISPVPSEKEEPKLQTKHEESPKSVSPVLPEKEQTIQPLDKDSDKSIGPLSSGKEDSKMLLDDREIPKTLSPVTSEKEQTIQPLDNDSAKSLTPLSSEIEEFKIQQKDKESLKITGSISTEEDDFKLTYSEKDGVSPVPSEKTDTLQYLDKDGAKSVYPELQAEVKEISESPVSTERDLDAIPIQDKDDVTSIIQEPSKKESSKISSLLLSQKDDTIQPIDEESTKTILSSLPSETEDLKLQQEVKDRPESVSPLLSVTDHISSQLQDKGIVGSKSILTSDKLEPEVISKDEESPKSVSPAPSEKDIIIQPTDKESDKSISPLPSEKEDHKVLLEDKSLKSVSPVSFEKDITILSAKDMSSVISEKEENKVSAKDERPKSVSPVPSEKDITIQSLDNETAKSKSPVLSEKEEHKVSPEDKSPKSVSPVPYEKDITIQPLDNESAKSKSPVLSEKENHKVSSEDKSPKSLSPVPSEKDITLQPLGKESAKSISLLSEKEELKVSPEDKSPKSISPVPSEKDITIQPLDNESAKSISPVLSEKEELKVSPEDKSPKSVSPVPSEKDVTMQTLDKENAKSISPVLSEKEESKILLEEKEVLKTIHPVPTEIDDAKLTSSEKDSVSPVPSEKDHTISPLGIASAESISPVPFEKNYFKMEQGCIDSSKVVSPVQTETDLMISKLQDNEDSVKSTSEKDEPKMPLDDESFMSVSLVSTERDDSNLPSVEKDILKSVNSEEIAKPKNKSSLPSEEVEKDIVVAQKESIKSEYPLPSKEDKIEIQPEYIKDTLPSEEKEKPECKETLKGVCPVPSLEDESKITSTEKIVTKSASPVSFDNDESKIRTQDQESLRRISPVSHEKDETLKEDSNKSESLVKFEKQETKFQVKDDEYPDHIALASSEKDESKLISVEKGSPKSLSSETSEKEEWLQFKDIKDSKTEISALSPKKEIILKADVKEHTSSDLSEKVEQREESIGSYKSKEIIELPLIEDQIQRERQDKVKSQEPREPGGEKLENDFLKTTSLSQSENKELELQLHKDSPKTMSPDEKKTDDQQITTSENDPLKSASPVLSEKEEFKLSTSRKESPKETSPEPHETDIHEISTSDNIVLMSAGPLLSECEESKLSPKEHDKKLQITEKSYSESNNLASSLKTESKTTAEKDFSESISSVKPEYLAHEENYGPLPTTDLSKDISSFKDQISGDLKLKSQLTSDVDKEVPSKSCDLQSQKDFSPIQSEKYELQSKTDQDLIPKSISPVPFEPEYLRVDKLNGYEPPKSPSPVGSERRKIRHSIEDKDNNTPKSISPEPSDDMKLTDQELDLLTTNYNQKLTTTLMSETNNFVELKSNIEDLQTTSVKKYTSEKDSLTHEKSVEDPSPPFKQEPSLDEKQLHSDKKDYDMSGEDDLHGGSLFTPGKTDVREILLDKNTSSKIEDYSYSKSVESSEESCKSILLHSDKEELNKVQKIENTFSKEDVIEKSTIEKQDFNLSEKSSDISKPQYSLNEEKLNVTESKEELECVVEEHKTSALDSTNLKQETSTKEIKVSVKTYDDTEGYMDSYISEESTISHETESLQREIKHDDGVLKKLSETLTSSLMLDKNEGSKTITSPGPDQLEHKKEIKTESFVTSGRSKQDMQGILDSKTKIDFKDITKENEDDTSLQRMVVSNAKIEDENLGIEVTENTQSGKSVSLESTEKIFEKKSKSEITDGNNLEFGYELETKAISLEEKRSEKSSEHKQLETSSVKSISPSKTSIVYTKGDKHYDGHDVRETNTKTTKTVYSSDDGGKTITTITKVTTTELPTGKQEIKVLKDDMATGSTINILRKETTEGRSGTPGSVCSSERDYEIGGPSTPHSDISSGQVSRAATNVWSRHGDSDEDVPCSPMSATSHVAHSPLQFDFEVHRTSEGSYFEESPKTKETKIPSAMTSSLYGSLPQEDPLQEHLEKKGIESSMYSSMYVSKYDDESDNEEYIGDVKGNFESMFKGEEVGFQQALTEHKTARGEDLSKYANGNEKSSMNGDSKHFVEFQEGIGEKMNGKSSSSLFKDPYSASSSASQKFVPGQPFETSGSLQKDEEKKKDPIEGWGKPLGLPPPPPPQRLDSPISPNSLDLIWNPEEEWGEPLGLPSPAPPPVKKDSLEGENDLTPNSNKTTPKKVAKKNVENNKTSSNTTAGKEVSNKSKRSESPMKRVSNKDRTSRPIVPIYMDLTYVPHHGNSHYTSVEFFKRVRARYYVFSGTEPSREVFNALLEAKQTWEDKDLEVTIIPTYDTDTLGYWVAENEEILAKYKIDLSPSASRCTINLQDHDTSCSAYRLEF